MKSHPQRSRVSRPPGARARRKFRKNGQLKSKREKAQEDFLTAFGSDFLLGMFAGFVIAGGTITARAPQGKKEKPN